MTIVTEFFKHQNFSGASETFTTGTNKRWHWIKFGSTLKNEITSIRSNVVSGRAANIYAFKNNDFTGKFASLNVPTGWTCWWSNVGADMNDNIESALILRRNSLEVVQPLHDLVVPEFKTEFDNATAGTQVKRAGEPTIYGAFFPPHDPNAMLVRLEQNVTVELDCWWDYDARVSFDVEFRLVDGQLDGYCKWYTIWVEGGVFSGKILDEMKPRIADACAILTDKLRQKLALLNFGAALAGYKFGSVYVLPGKVPTFPPTGDYGRVGSHAEDCCLVVTRTA